MADSSTMSNLGQSGDSRRNPSTAGTATGNASGTNTAKSRRRAGKGKGRMMMIKVFYSLQSPRFGSPPAPSAPTPVASAASPDFFAVLDPSLSSSSTATPNPVPIPSLESSNSATNYSCIARLSAPVWVQVIGSSKKNQTSDERAQFGRITLKTCLSAICISRPELVIDSTKDFSVSAVDPYESSSRRQPFASSTSSSDRHSGSANGTNDDVAGLVEGKGMLSWTLAEKKEGTTMVCGKIAGSEAEARRSKRRKGDDGNAVADYVEDEDSESGDESEETLEVWLQLSERDAFTQGQFLDCLRSYHNPVQQLQSELSEFNSSPPKPNRRESAPFSSSSTETLTGPKNKSSSSASVAPGDPVKRKRPQDRQSLPLSASTTALPLAPPSAFINLSSSAQPAPTSVPSTTANGSTADAVPGQNPDLLALLSQLVSSSSSASSNPSSSAPRLDISQNQEALQSLARLCGLPVPEASLPPPPSTQAPTSTSGPAPKASARPPKTSTSTVASGSEVPSAARKRREHFAAIDTTEIKGQGKNNPRDPNGCSNCKRKKSTVWREGLDSEGNPTSVCNACGTFYNKNGYHRSKGAAEATASNSNRAHPSSASASASHPKTGRPLTGRLTATCEADLNKRKARKKLGGGSPDSSTSSRIFGGSSGIIPPLSPSKHIGPRSPSLVFGFGSSSSRTSSSRAPGIMSSPGRSPRLRQRQGGNTGAAATSPLRAPADAFAQDGGFDFAALFGGHASPSPRKRTLSGNGNIGGSSGEKGVPNYLLTASPGTALDRILNDTNIGTLSSLGDPMQVDGGSTLGDSSNPFSFFLQPGSPSREHKENERPRAATVGPSSTANEAPATDADSFESVLSSLRRDFNNRLSSNALTAPSSPVPSSPCVQPRTSTATPGSKGKAPLTSGRPPPSIFDSFADGLETGIVLDGKAEGNGRTPHSDSDAWSPLEGPDNTEDRTVSLDSLLRTTNQVDDSAGDLEGGVTKPRPDEQYGRAYSHLLVPNKLNGSSTSKRPTPLPSHLLGPSHLGPASDATDFDLGSLPPSSPPQLPSETFPTPSDFDGVTPGTEGGDGEDRDRSIQEEQERLTIEAVAEKVATEPNEEARTMILALLRSVGTGDGKKEDMAVNLPGIAGGEKITLDRSTVDKLLSLISAKPSTPPAALQSVLSSTTPAETSDTTSETLASNIESTTQASPDLSQIDFFNSFASSSHAQGQNDLQHSEQMNGLYSDLFAGTQF